MISRTNLVGIEKKINRKITPSAVQMKLNHEKVLSPSAPDNSMKVLIFRARSEDEFTYRAA